MIDIQKLQQEHEKKLQEALAANAIETTLPVPPNLVVMHSSKNSCPWVCYKVDNLAEAVELADKFEWLPINYAKNGCAVLKPEALLGEYADHVELCFDGAPVLDLNTINGNMYSADLSLYTYVEGRLLYVKIEMKCPPAYISVRYSGDPRFSSRRDVTKVYPTRLHEDKVIYWGSGSHDSAHASYVWGSYDGYRASMDALLGR